jgi:hypothetical protein
LLKTLSIPPAEHLWALELGFQSGGRKSANSRFFLFRSLLSLFCALFSSRFCALFASLSRARKCEKKVPAPTFDLMITKDLKNYNTKMHKK